MSKPVLIEAIAIDGFGTRSPGPTETVVEDGIIAVIASSRLSPRLDLGDRTINPGLKSSISL
jgi:hypothetical protein